MQDLFRVGVISATHGIKGEVKVYPTTDDPDRFRHLKEVLIYDNENIMPLEITGVKFFKHLVILKFKGFDRIEDVEKFKKRDLYVTRENAIPLEDGEHYIADLIGLKVLSEKGIYLGTLTDVLQTGANDVYIVENADGKEILLPAIRDCILNIDMDNRIMTVKILEGLMD